MSRLALMCMGICLGMLLTGCQPKKTPAPPPPKATPLTVRSLQQSYQKIDPDARVGLVTAVRAVDQLVAVSEIETQGFKEGEPLTFIDAKEQIIGTGKVVNIVGGTLHVKYAVPAAGQRAPEVGDLAVRVK